MRVWLSNEEFDAPIDYAEIPYQRLAFFLGGRVGLRRSEIIQIIPNGLIERATGKRVRIWEDYAKRDQYREPPVPDNVEAIANTLVFE